MIEWECQSKLALRRVRKWGTGNLHLVSDSVIGSGRLEFYHREHQSRESVLDILNHLFYISNEET